MIIPSELEKLLEKTHVAFTEDLLYIHKTGEVIRPKYINTEFGRPTRPMIWVATRGQTMFDKSESLMRGLLTLHDGSQKEALDYLGCDDYRYLMYQYIKKYEK